jgi:hypothetical protein
LWVIRLSLALGKSPRWIEEELTAEDLAHYQAAVEIDGPWWCGEHVAGHVRELCSITAAAGGVSIPPDEFKVPWAVGARDPDQAAGFNLIPPEDGLAAFAARHGLDLVEVPNDGTVATHLA